MLWVSNSNWVLSIQFNIIQKTIAQIYMKFSFEMIGQNDLFFVVLFDLAFFFSLSFLIDQVLNSSLSVL